MMTEKVNHKRNPKNKTKLKMTITSTMQKHIELQLQHSRFTELTQSLMLEEE